MRRHVFTAAYSYELPFGKGKALLNNAGLLMNALVGGWEIAGITYLRTGTPFSLGITTTQTGWRATRPNASWHLVRSRVRTAVLTAGSIPPAILFRLRSRMAIPPATVCLDPETWCSMPAC